MVLQVGFHLTNSVRVLKFLFFLCRVAAENRDSITQRAQSLLRLNTSSNVGKRQSALQKETITIDATAAAADLGSQPGENKNDDSSVEYGRHDQQYSSNFNRHFMQVCGRKRNSAHFTGNDQSSNSGHIYIDTDDSNSIAQRAQRPFDFRTSSHVRKGRSILRKETMIAAAAKTADLDSQRTENKNDECVEYGRHNQQYSGNFNRHFMQVCGRKRNGAHFTGNDQSSNSDHIHIDTEIAENSDVVGSEHDDDDTAVPNVKKKKTVDKMICKVCGWVCSTSESLEAHMRTLSGVKSMECNVSVPVNTKADTHQGLKSTKTSAGMRTFPPPSHLPLLVPSLLSRPSLLFRPISPSPPPISS